MKDPSDRIAEIIKRYPDLSRDNLIPILQETQNELGYLSEEALKKVASTLRMPLSKVFGLASFYNQFRFTPPGKYQIRLCNGTSCHLGNSGTIKKEIYKLLGIAEGEKSRDGLFSLEVSSCNGGCGNGPVVSVNGAFYQNMTREKIRELIENLKNAEDIA
jgi:NADH-quinone oxidoreductase subunit E